MNLEELEVVNNSSTNKWRDSSGGGRHCTSRLTNINFMVDVCTQRLYVKTPYNNCKISCNTVVGLKDGCPVLGVITISIPMSLRSKENTY